MATVPGFTGSATAGPQGDITDVAATNTLTAGAQIQNNQMMGLGQLNSQYASDHNLQTGAVPSGIGAAGQWYSGARKVALGNDKRHFLDASADIISSANNSMSTLYQNQGLAALGLVVA